MNENHYKEKLSEYLDYELPVNERQKVAEHLLQCADCRDEHDQLKFAAALAARLPRKDAPEALWKKLETALDAKTEKRISPLSRLPFFGARSFTAAAAILLVVFGVTAALYLSFSQNDAPELARRETPAADAKPENPPALPAAREDSPPQTANAAPQTSKSNPSAGNAPDENPNIAPRPPVAAASVRRAPPENAFEPKKNSNASNENSPALKSSPAEKALPAWNVETISGAPRIGNSLENARLSVGETLETDARSRARIEVADIGNVEIAPNSRVQLVRTNPDEHRLSLERGLLRAQIFAPPRLFIVDTPSAAAVDLGCEYTLEVDADGGSRIHVTSGFVALEDGRRESIVPAGAVALTKKGKGVGTPFAENASAALQNAVFRFDFENGGREALQMIINESTAADALTLWHLLARAPLADRGQVFDALARRVAPPATVTREGVLKLDKKMLDAWWTEIENAWFE